MKSDGLCLSLHLDFIVINIFLPIHRIKKYSTSRNYFFQSWLKREIVQWLMIHSTAMDIIYFKDSVPLVFHSRRICNDFDANLWCYGEINSYTISWNLTVIAYPCSLVINIFLRIQRIKKYSTSHNYLSSKLINMLGLSMINKIFDSHGYYIFRSPFRVSTFSYLANVLLGFIVRNIFLRIRRIFLYSTSRNYIFLKLVKTRGLSMVNKIFDSHGCYIFRGPRVFNFSY